MLLESLSCHEPSLVLEQQQPAKLDPQGVFPDGQGEPLQPGLGETHTGAARILKDFLYYYPWTEDFPWNIATPPDRIMSLTYGFAWTSSNAASCSRHLTVVSIALNVQTAINRFCSGSVDFPDGPCGSVCPGFQRTRIFSACFSTSKGWNSITPVDPSVTSVSQALLGCTGLLSVELTQQLEAPCSLVCW